MPRLIHENTEDLGFGDFTSQMARVIEQRGLLVCFLTMPRTDGWWDCHAVRTSLS